MSTSEAGNTDEDWDADQLRVIHAESNERLIVDAGPGTGKTAVACARLAHLINEEDIEPSKTWMIGFTRTAVAEIRARLHSYVGEASSAIGIATIDAQAWSIHSGHVPNAKLTGSYEDNIERVIELLKSDDDVADELSQIEHIIIDEAQDIVGQRADLIWALVGRLDAECGVTVFADEAQAIYGFTDDSIGPGERTSSHRRISLLKRLAAKKEARFKMLALQKIYRTSSPGLRKIFSEIRKDLLDVENKRKGLYAETAEKIRGLADQSELTWKGFKVSDYSAEHLILFRTRAEVLKASQYCDVPHRLRLSGYGGTLPPWLALCFFDYFDPLLSEKVFLDLWSKRVANLVSPQYEPAEAWYRLLRLAGKTDGTVEMKRLRSRLSQTRPPVELAEAEYGLLGPIVGTIHSSKGREADNVILLLPNVSRSEFDDVEEEAEEARVLFVGATRARTSLTMGDGIRPKSATLPSGRAYGWTGKQKTEIEIGRKGDVSPRGLVGRSLLRENEAKAAQSFLAKMCNIVTTYTLWADSGRNWQYRIQADKEICVGYLSREFGNDLWNILNKQGKNRNSRPPDWLNYVRGQGCSTIVLASDSSELEDLHKPWAESGFVLAPRISAFPPFGFKSRKWQ